MKKYLVLPLVVSCLAYFVGASACGESADDYWPAWRGPKNNGVAPNANPPLTWSDTENIKWKAAIPGNSDSSPVVWGDKVFILTAIKTETLGPFDPEAADRPRFAGVQMPTNVHKFDVVCLERATGEILWQKTAREEMPHQGHHPDHGFASFPPLTDGELVWAYFGSRGLHCYDVDGNHKWSVDLGKMMIDDEVGEGGSPALAGDAVIVAMDHEGDSTITVLSKKSGGIIWQKARDGDNTAWPSPLVVEVDGRLQVVVAGTGQIRCYDVETGDQVWHCEGLKMNAIPSPVSGFGKVFCMSGFRDNILRAIDLGRTGDLTGTEAIAWEMSRETPYIPSPILYDGKLFFCRSNKDMISCHDAETGNAYFTKQRLSGLKQIYASPVGAAGRVYFIGRTGTAQVIRCSDKFEVLATNRLDDAFDASPAIAGDELFLKGTKYLYCIAEP